MSLKKSLWDAGTLKVVPMNTPFRRAEQLVSAGGVVYRRDDSGVAVILCGRHAHRTWALPKGTPEPGESLEDTAFREVQEETGLDVRSERVLGSIDYWFVRSQDEVRCHKTVHFYLMVSTGGTFDRHDSEFDEVRWFSAQDALSTMTYLNEARMVEKALVVLGQWGDDHE